ncbi:MAG TPA: tetratricopeptide repeat protein, partial [Capsulimonadaceae bacterium]|nr:tetratricopeptide repeat protein [Capsulimonadaceae bacterium]
MMHATQEKELSRRWLLRFLTMIPLLAVCLVRLHGNAWADQGQKKNNPKASSSSSREDQARAHYLRGERLEAQGDFTDALAEFQEALRLKPTSQPSKDAIARLKAKQTPPELNAKPLPMPTEADLYNALKKGCYGTQDDRLAADVLFRRVLQNDDIEPVNYVLYPVYGYSVQEIRSSQEQTKSLAGISEWGYTKSTWSSHYDTSNHVQFILKTSISMPQWTPKSPDHTTPPSYWPGFYNALLFHEQGHALIGEYIVALMRLRINAADAPDAANETAIINQAGGEVDTL